jgi:RNA polymerase subunit RPABC4/transcription elongation factor Spt4
MFDSRQLLQFVVDRKLGFKSNRNLTFNQNRTLLFNYQRQLGFDMDRDLPFGKHGPVFRGRACPKCKALVPPLDDVCMECGTSLPPLRRRTAAQASRVQRTQAEQRARQVTKPADKPQAASTMVCPNCALKIPTDSVYCPRCRVKIDEWRTYLRDLKRWEEAQRARSQPQVPRYPPQRQDEQYYDVNVRRRR